MTFPIPHTLLAAATMSLALAATAPAVAAPAEGCATIEVQQVRPERGRLLIQAFVSNETYRSRPQAQIAVGAGSQPTQRVELCGLGANAEVALLMYQDLDADGRLATNLFGMPTEPWGASGAPGPLGPTWDKTRVALGKAPIVVRLTD